jgi:hypothetical protein
LLEDAHSPHIQPLPICLSLHLACFYLLLFKLLLGLFAFLVKLPLLLP